MTTGPSLLLITVGAILRWAVSDSRIGGVDLEIVGLILLIAGVVGIVLGLFLTFTRREPGATAPPERYERDPRHN